MQRGKRWKEDKHKRDGGAFIAIPLAVLKSKAYCMASAHARMLLLDLFVQCNGDNNGDLCAAWKVMKPRGWRSEDTLAKAKRELLQLGLIVETRKGARPNKASLYAVTWRSLDNCGGKLDMSAQSFPRGLYRQHDTRPAILINGTPLNTVPVAGRYAIATPTVATDLATTTPAVPIRP